MAWRPAVGWLVIAAATGTVALGAAQGSQGAEACTSAPVLLQRPGAVLSVALETVLPREEAQDHLFKPAGPRSVLLQEAATATWHRWSPPPTLRDRGVWAFFFSAHLGYWLFLASFLAAALGLRVGLLDRLLSQGRFLTGLVSLTVLGLIYNLIVLVRQGSGAGGAWAAGYLLEMVFAIENVFVFQVIATTLRMTRALTQQVLQYVVWGQILLEMVFFMGLADRLRRVHFLPYALGLWLVSCGVATITEQDQAADHAADMPLAEGPTARALRAFLGEEVLSSMAREDVARDCDSGARTAKSATPLVAAVCVFLVADFFLEVDVVLTKIEEIPNEYIAFSSSAMASLALPELYFACSGLLHRYALLKYGIGLVLMLFGLQMLLAHVYVLPPVAACCIVAAILLVSLALSSLPGRWNKGSLPEPAAEPVSFPPPSPTSPGAPLPAGPLRDTRLGQLPQTAADGGG